MRDIFPSPESCERDARMDGHDSVPLARLCLGEFWFGSCASVAVQMEMHPDESG